LTTLENARMEWNAARLKFPVLTGAAQEGAGTAPAAGAPAPSLFAKHTFGELCRLGFALTWPLAGIATLALAALLVFLFRR
jgi:hypothetical protein